MYKLGMAMGLCIIFATGGSLRATLFDEAKRECAQTLADIEAHPFIVQLANGTLPTAKFCYYLAQDDLYLDDYARTLALLSAKAHEASHQTFLMRLALSAIESEKDSVHAHYANSLCTNVEPGQTPALFAYQNFLLASSALQSFEVGYAATVPCDWIYGVVAKWIANQTVVDNPYAAWIDYYSSADENDVMTNYFSELAESASVSEQQRMLTAFKEACVLELKFWDDAYHLKKR